VLGDELAHVELVLDAGAGSLTAYVLDAEALRGVSIDAPVLNVAVTIGESSQTVPLHPVENPLTGEQVGSTSQYQGASDLLKGADRFAGSIPEITVKGQTFRAVEFDYPEGNE
jgi:hypothetical protein